MPSKLDPDTIFAYCDKNGDGKLSRKEFLQALRCGGACPTALDFEEICREHGQCPEYPAFREALQVLLQRRPTQEVLADKLGGLAQDGLGLWFLPNLRQEVDADSLRFIVTNFGEKLSEEELAELLKLAEPDAEGNVSAPQPGVGRAPLVELGRPHQVLPEHWKPSVPNNGSERQSAVQEVPRKVASAEDKATANFTRKAFKWTRSPHKTDEELFKLQARVNGRVQPSAPAQEMEQLPKPELPTPAVQEHKQFSLVEVSNEEERLAAFKCHMDKETFVNEEHFVKERLWNSQVHRCRSLSSDIRSGLPGGRDAARESVRRVAQELGAGGECERRTGAPWVWSHAVPSSGGFAASGRS
ncbi:unnamed protein product [Effrenium voratum]|uniref:EF-hand domain-containing protein n=1 Tax=Effrenium voratum TaxID=2562239 RepID=A0AA36N9G9_9DINO|nr:unnamed protein product [Effrenium voratum]